MDDDWGYPHDDSETSMWMSIIELNMNHGSLLWWPQVLASYKPGDAEKLGLDAKTLRREHPRLIYESRPPPVNPENDAAFHQGGYPKMDGL